MWRVRGGLAMLLCLALLDVLASTPAASAHASRLYLARRCFHPACPPVREGSNAPGCGEGFRRCGTGMPTHRGYPTARDAIRTAFQTGAPLPKGVTRYTGPCPPGGVAGTLRDGTACSERVKQQAIRPPLFVYAIVPRGSFCCDYDPVRYWYLGRFENRTWTYVAAAPCFNESFAGPNEARFEKCLRGHRPVFVP
jgi:hypothetical protein